MQFSTGIIAPLIIQPLRYFFSTYTKESNIYWDPDEKKRTMEIGESFDFNKIPIHEKPRVIVTRGEYSLAKVSLSDSLAEGKPFSETRGLKDYSHFLMYNGVASILIEARNKGTCELLTDMVSHFIAWTRPVLCDSQGFKEFGLPMGVSDCMNAPGEDVDQPKFQVRISIPWTREEHWKMRNDGVELKKVIQTITPQY